MKKLLLLLLPVLVFACTDYTEDFNTINDRLDKLEQKVPTIDDQIASIRTSIANLEAIKEQLEKSIKALEASNKATAEEIAALKKADSAIELRIAELQKYIDDSLKSTKDWASATFATLEQLNTLSSEIVTLKNLINTNETESAANLADAIATLETSLKSWVGEQLSNYYTIAEVEAKITALQSAIAQGDEALQEELNTLKMQLKTTATEITAAYKKAIEEAINTNNGVVNAKIASEIAAVNLRIDSEVATINAKIAELQAQVNQNTENIAKLLARIQSITYIPTYDDGKATVKHMNRVSQVTLDFKVSPKECVVELAKVWENSVKVEVVYTQTRAISFVDMPIVKFDADTENGIISVIASGENLSEEVFTGTQSTSVSLVISDGNSSVASEYIPMVATEVELKDLLVPSNEIWYTSTDGEIVEPTRSDAFDVRVISNTYKDGMGILKFDGDLTQIYLYAFCDQETQLGASNLKTITFPKAVRYIGDYAFNNCTSLTEVAIPGSIEMRVRAFGGCTNIAKVYISDLATWCNCKFVHSSTCSPLGPGNAELYLNGEKVIDLIIPSNISRIYHAAFAGCSSLNSVVIPSNITHIHSFAFAYCKQLKTVFCESIVPPAIDLSDQGYWDAFKSNHYGRMIYVPRESVEAYKTADGWKDYANYIVGYDF